MAWGGSRAWGAHPERVRKLPVLTIPPPPPSVLQLTIDTPTTALSTGTVEGDTSDAEFEVSDAVIDDNDGTDEHGVSDVASVTSEADWGGDEHWEVVG